MRLVLAGHCDERLPQVRALVGDLRRMAAELRIEGQFRLVFSPTDDEVGHLLEQCTMVVYTPVAEHFGYVPVEAMAAGRPVIAVASGGPTETIVDGHTGFLRPATADAFASALVTIITNPAWASEAGQAGRLRVRDHFSIDAFGNRLEAFVAGLLAGTRRHAPATRGDSES